MKVAFIFAHPDDETVACAGTIAQLSRAGHEVKIISVTSGDAGEVVSQGAQAKLKKYQSVGRLRTEELKAAAEIMGASKSEVWSYKDGQLQNQDVWGRLLLDIVDSLTEYQPDMVITFDHTGWYYHLDHIAVSIATTLAVQKLEKPLALFWHVLMPIHMEKWRYVYAQQLPVTHLVEITAERKMKQQALAAHESQNLSFPNQLMDFPQQFELYQLIHASDDGIAWLKSSPFSELGNWSDNQLIQRLINRPE